MIGAMRPRTRQLEHGEQSVVVAWLRTRRHHVFAVPNAAKRSASLGAYMRKEGCLSGVPDLILITPPPSQPFTHVAIEMKRRDGKTRDISPTQLIVHEQMRANGWQVLVCFGSQMAIDALVEMGY